MSRKVLIDFQFLKYLNDGFGQLTLSYGLFFLHNPEKYSDLDITLFVPKEYVGKFGDKVKYMELSKKYKLFPFLLPQFDIAHSITQQIKYTPLNNKTYHIITIHDLNFLYQRTDPRKVNRKLKQFAYRLKTA